MTDPAIGAHFDESAVDAIFAVVDQCQLPGAAIGIAIGGEPVYRKGFGLANMELPALLTPNMRMRIGSSTKHFACLAYMLLCEDGLAGIDDPVSRHVPDLQPVTGAATMRQLMSHTGGVRDLITLSMAMHGLGRPVSDRELLAYYQTIDDGDFAPGTHWSYDNGGYLLLTAAIEAIAGEPLDDVLRKRIFAPVGMNDTMLRRWDSGFVPNSATLHYRDTGGQFSHLHMGMELSGAGGMVSTMDDMLLWLRHMDAPVVGSAETWRVMRTPQVLSNGTSTGYGLGLTIERYRGVEVVHHAGGIIGGNSQMIKVPAAGLDISIGVNRADVSAVGLALQVIDACVEGLDPLPAVSDYEKRTGTFVSATSGRIVTLSEKGGVHLMAVDGGGPVPMTPDAAGVLQLPAAAAFLRQSVRIENDGIVFVDFGNEEALAEVQVDPEAKLGSRAGTYRSQALDAEFVVMDHADGDRAIVRGRHGWAEYTLEAITADIWRIEQTLFKPFAAILTFDSEGLVFDNTRLRHVRFDRID